jgi:hypothetical protein
MVLRSPPRTSEIMNRTESELDALLEFDRQPCVAYVEIDRFCDGCGYNLRTQPVRRIGRTELLLCRCPECGRFQSVRDAATAGRLWLSRLGSLLLFVWIMVVLGAAFGLAAGQVGLTLLPLEELTTHRPVTTTAPSLSIPALASMPANLLGSTITVIQQGNLVYRTVTTYGREVREDYPYYTAFVLLMRGLSFALGFVLAMLATVVLYHWRRWGYLVAVAVVSIGAAVVVWCIWREDQPQLLGWANPHIAAQAAAHFAGGLAGILLGRPLARLIAMLVLPPRVRQALAFLWLVDGKQLPAVVAEQ